MCVIDMHLSRHRSGKIIIHFIVSECTVVIPWESFRLRFFCLKIYPSEKQVLKHSTGYLCCSPQHVWHKFIFKKIFCFNLNELAWAKDGTCCETCGTTFVTLFSSYKKSACDHILSTFILPLNTNYKKNNAHSRILNSLSGGSAICDYYHFHLDNSGILVHFLFYFHVTQNDILTWCLGAKHHLTCSYMGIIEIFRRC